MNRIAGLSPRQLARIAGGLYLLNIVGGAFAIGFVPAVVVVAGNAAATAHNIQANEQLLSPGFAAHLVPYIQLPSLVGEGSLCLWFLIVGLSVQRWKERASAAGIPSHLAG